jgi:alanine racemase
LCSTDIATFARALRISRGVHVEGLWTHLHAADEPQRTETSQQLERFASARAELASHGVRPRIVHAANSAGALLRDDARYSMVRIGIAMYGISPTCSAPLPVKLQPALRLESRVATVRPVPAGDAVSYGTTHRVAADTRVATIPIGYADGVPRTYGVDGGTVLIGGAHRRIVGFVTMDHVMAEVDESVKPGDAVVLLGAQGDECIAVEDWANIVGTNGYEVVARIGGRVARAYLDD